MRITLNHQGDFRFDVATDNGQAFRIDSAGPDGKAAAPSPMQLVATAMGGCSAIDIVDILTKGRQTVDSFEIEVEAERAERAPRVFTNVHIHFALSGELTEERVRRAVLLSLEKYCSVAKMLEKAVPITASFSINGERFECRLGG